MKIEIAAGTNPRGGEVGMKTWARLRLDQYAEVVSGATPDTTESSYWSGDICWATPKDLSELEGAYISETPRKITHRGLASCAASILPPESVLFSSRAPIGHVAINTIPMATNQGFKSFVPDRQRIHPKFLYHWLRKNRSYLESLGNGATFKEVSKAVVSRVEIDLPPLPEQKRIAAILDQADALRAKRREALAELGKLTQSIFIEMFGDPIHGKSKAKEVPFEEITTRITYGFTSPMKHLGSGIPILTAKNVQQGFLDMINVHYANQEEFDALTSKSKPRRGDILITKDGTIGRTAVVETEEKICINQSVGNRSDPYGPAG